MYLENNKIELKVGDVFRLNRARKKNTVVNMFDYNGKTYVVYIDDTKYPSFTICEYERLCSVYIYYGNFFDGVVEVNGMTVRGLGGKILDNPKPVTTKTVKETKTKMDVKEKTAFEKFLSVQKSGVINMTDIVTGSRLAGISEEKYEDILFHYDEYKSGMKK